MWVKRRIRVGTGAFGVSAMGALRGGKSRLMTFREGNGNFWDMGVLGGRRVFRFVTVFLFSFKKENLH